eukprot:6188353-Pleurochrysis_carterae.AAC.6
MTGQAVHSEKRAFGVAQVCKDKSGRKAWEIHGNKETAGCLYSWNYANVRGSVRYAGHHQLVIGHRIPLAGAG